MRSTKMIKRMCIEEGVWVWNCWKNRAWWYSGLLSIMIIFGLYKHTEQRWRERRLFMQPYVTTLSPSRHPVNKKYWAKVEEDEKRIAQKQKLSWWPSTWLSYWRSGAWASGPSRWNRSRRGENGWEPAHPCWRRWRQFCASICRFHSLIGWSRDSGHSAAATCRWKLTIKVVSKFVKSN